MNSQMENNASQALDPNSLVQAPHHAFTSYSAQPNSYRQLCTLQQAFDTLYFSGRQRILETQFELEQQHMAVQEEQEKSYRSQTQLLTSVQAICRQLTKENNELRDIRDEFEEYQKNMSSHLEQSQSLLEGRQYDITDLRATNNSLETQVSRLERERDDLQAKYDELLASTEIMKCEQGSGDRWEAPAVDMKQEWTTIQAINKNLFERNQALQHRCTILSKRKYNQL